MCGCVHWQQPTLLGLQAPHWQQQRPATAALLRFVKSTNVVCAASIDSVPCYVLRACFALQPTALRQAAGCTRSGTGATLATPVVLGASLLRARSTPTVHARPAEQPSPQKEPNPAPMLSSRAYTAHLAVQSAARMRRQRAGTATKTGALIRSGRARGPQSMWLTWAAGRPTWAPARSRWLCCQ